MKAFESAFVAIIKIYKIKYYNITFYCEGGESNLETVIFLHGSGPGATSETNWRDILPALTDGYHVIAPDMYGFGNTKHPETPPKSFWEWTNCRVEQVLELMDHLKIDTAKLVGNSMGGYVSLNLVMTAPERLKSYANGQCGSRSSTNSRNRKNDRFL